MTYELHNEPCFFLPLDGEDRIESLRRGVNESV